jgi:hypothetical protein
MGDVGRNLPRNLSTQFDYARFGCGLDFPSVRHGRCILAFRLEQVILMPWKLL